MDLVLCRPVHQRCGGKGGRGGHQSKRVSMRRDPKSGGGCEGQGVCPASKVSIEEHACRGSTCSAGQLWVGSLAYRRSGSEGGAAVSVPRPPSRHPVVLRRDGGAVGQTRSRFARPPPLPGIFAGNGERHVGLCRGARRGALQACAAGGKLCEWHSGWRRADRACSLSFPLMLQWADANDVPSATVLAFGSGMMCQVPRD